MSSENVTDGERIPLPTIALNVANLREQIAGAPPAQSDDYEMGETGSNESIIRSSVITSAGGRDDNGQSSSRTQDDEQMNDTHPKFTTCSNTINGTSCNSDDKFSNTDSFGTTENDLFLLCDDEINPSSSDDESIITSVSQQDNDRYKYNYWIQGDGQTNYNRSKFTTCNNTTNSNPCNCDLGDYYMDDEVRTTDNFGATRRPDFFQCSDDEMDVSTSNSGSIGSTITAFSGQDIGSNYNWTENDERTNDSSSNFSGSNNMTDGIASNYGDPGDYNSDNGVNITDCSGTNEQTKASSDGENINTASRSENYLVRSTVITSVREQENGCFVYLTEYDEAMNEIRSEMYDIERPITTGLEEPLGSFIVTSAIRHRGCDIECMEQSSEDVREPQLIIFERNQNNQSPTGDDETDSKM